MANIFKGGNKMDQKTFDQIICSRLDFCKELLVQKGEEYAADNYDRLHAFKTAGALANISPVQALAGMMAKHTVSIYDMCKDPGAYSLEKWSEKITDHINYLLILDVMIAEYYKEEILSQSLKEEK